MDTPTFLTDALRELPESSRDDLREAYATAKRIYGDRRSPTGEPCIEQVAAVAELLLPFHPDGKTLIATLLQHTDARDHLPSVTERFDRDVGTMIASLSILERGCSATAQCSAEKLRKMILTLAGDIRVLLICLHNRWHALRRADHLPPEERKVLAVQALEVFSPICARLGIYALKYELETLGFLIIHPREAEETGRKFLELCELIGPLLSESAVELKRMLKRAEGNMEICGREKHPASIFRKIQCKNLNDVREIYDLFGIRILVPTIEDCYRALGVIHRNYRPIIHRIKDYIAMPKPNGYRSLHTTVLGLSKKDPTIPVEIQIRTFEMEEEAEHGIAAHWNYKEGGTGRPATVRIWQERMKALQAFPSSQERYEEFNDILREEFSDRIFVLTPQGDPIELPKGATPLDFAFRIHTDVGLRFRGSKVNSRIAPIDQELENGDMVEILKWKDPRPSEKWIQLVRTKDARQKLRSFFRTVASEQAAASLKTAKSMSR